MQSQSPIFTFSKTGVLDVGEFATVRVAPWDSSNMGNYNMLTLDVDGIVPGMNLFAVRLFEFPTGTGLPFAFQEVQAKDRSAIPTSNLLLVDGQTAIQVGSGVVLDERVTSLTSGVLSGWRLPRGVSGGREWVAQIQNLGPNPGPILFGLNLTLRLSVDGSL